MTKIAFIGAGSTGFCRVGARHPGFFRSCDAHIALMDINVERLISPNRHHKIITEDEYPATVSATLDRVEARDADVVLTTIWRAPPRCGNMISKSPRNTVWISTLATRAAPAASSASCAPCLR